MINMLHCLHHSPLQGTQWSGPFMRTTGPQWSSGPVSGPNKVLGRTVWTSGPGLNYDLTVYLGIFEYDGGNLE